MSVVVSRKCGRDLCVCITLRSRREDFVRIRICHCVLRSLLLILLGSTFLFAGTQSRVGDYQVASRPIATVTHASMTNDITLAAIITWTARSEREAGTRSIAPERDLREWHRSRVERCRQDNGSSQRLAQPMTVPRIKGGEETRTYPLAVLHTCSAYR